MEIWIYQGIISIITTLIMYMLLAKFARNLIENKEIQYKEALETWLNSEKGTKALYGIGLIIASGAKQSLGINQRSGKLKWKDLLVQTGIEFATKKILPGLGQNLSNVSGVETQPTQELNTKKVDRVLRSA